MKIAIAQIQPVKGDIPKNIRLHQKWINIAIEADADLIVFSELSLTGYEPELAEELALPPNAPTLDLFQQISNLHQISIALGLPTSSERGNHISMLIFQPNRTRQVYTKQMLHQDECPYFVAGNTPLLFEVEDQQIAPAICYESLQPKHSEQAHELGATLYLASVAKAQKGIDKAFYIYPRVAQKYAMPVLMSNCIGPCDNFLGAGQSSVWNSHGVCLESLGKAVEGILVYDTKTGMVIKKTAAFLNNF